MAPTIVQSTKEHTMPLIAVKNRGRRPTLSTMKATPMEIDRSMMVLPVVSYPEVSISFVRLRRYSPKGTYTELLVLVLDTSAFVDYVNVVGEESISRVLRNDAERYDDSKPPSVSLGSDKVEVARAGLRVAIRLDCLFDLSVLELDGRVVHITPSMMLRQNCKSFLGLVFVYEETRRLGNPPDADELDERGEALKHSDGAPRPVVVDSRGTPADDGNDCSVYILACL